MNNVNNKSYVCISTLSLQCAHLCADREIYILATLMSLMYYEQEEEGEEIVEKQEEKKKQNRHPY